MCAWCAGGENDGKCWSDGNSHDIHVLSWKLVASSFVVLLQWRAPTGVLPCRSEVVRAHDRGPSSRLSGSQCCQQRFLSARRGLPGGSGRGDFLTNDSMVIVFGIRSCLKNRSSLPRIREEAGGQLVVFLIVALVQCLLTRDHYVKSSGSRVAVLQTC